MRIIKDVFDFEADRECVVTIGTFDGVHKGHQKIIRSMSNDEGLATSVFTLFPHPRMVLNKGDVRLIQTIEERLKVFESLGLDQVVVQPFSKEFANTEAEEFAKILKERIKARKVIVGYDHRFGRGGKADINDLREFGKKYGFQVEQIMEEDYFDMAISSTKIRNYLEAGDVVTANKLMDREFTITGEVVHGMQLGRKLGYPTANISIKEDYKLIPKKGIYAVWSEIEDKRVNGMMSIGSNPTIEGKGESIEVNFFDYDGDLYDRELVVRVVEYTREEVKFENIQELENQLKRDEKAIRKIFEIC